MIDIQAFRAFRPKPELASQVASPPYDVVSTDQAKEIINKNSESFMKVIRSDSQFHQGEDPYSDIVYQKAKSNFDDMLKRGVFVRDSTPNFYLYRQEMEEHSQTGLVALFSLKDYRENRIKKHEFTRQVKELDRVRHIEAMNAHTGPVFLTYRDQSEINSLTQSWTRNHDPVVDFKDERDVRHSVWVMDGESEIAQLRNLFRSVPALYVADGHHRIAAANKVAEKNDYRNGYDSLLGVLFPESEMQVLAYNRVVKDLNGLSKVEFLRKLESHFEITRSESDVVPRDRYEFGLCLYTDWFRLRFKVEQASPVGPVESLSVSVLQNYVLGPVLGIEDPRTSDRIDFVGGVHGNSELESRCRSGVARVAFSLYPTSVSDLFEVADLDQVMPPKSTWFEPKLKSGLIVNVLGEGEI